MKDKSLRKLFVCAQCTRRYQEDSFSTLKTHRLAQYVYSVSGYGYFDNGCGQNCNFYVIVIEEVTQTIPEEKQDYFQTADPLTPPVWECPVNCN